METTVRPLERLLSLRAVRQLDELIGDREDATVAVQELDGTMRWASAPGASSMFKRQLQEFAGEQAVDFIHPDQHGTYLAAYRRAIAGETVSVGLRASAGDGSWVEVRTVLWRVDDAGGAPIVISVTTPAPATLT